jgi:hypothetical protein
VISFLVHDSPREADLGGSIYGRLFNIVEELESLGASALFQYVLTTTTARPRITTVLAGGCILAR